MCRVTTEGANVKNEWGPLAKFMYAREAKAKCEYVAWKYKYDLLDSSGEQSRFNQEYSYYGRLENGNLPPSWRNFVVRPSLDIFGKEDEGMTGEQYRDILEDKGRHIHFTMKQCGRRSCYNCQRSRMGQWGDRIRARAASSNRRLYFVTPTLPGDEHGRREWNQSLQSAYDVATDWWRLSRVKVAVGKKRSKSYVNSTMNCVRVLEIPENDDGYWNPHYHVLTESDRGVATVRNHWKQIWSKDGVSPRLQVKPVTSSDELADYITKVTKYMTKGDQVNSEVDDVMFRKHNVSFCGSWRYADTIKEE